MSNMSGTDQFFQWFFTGLNGLGGWFVFFAIAVIAVVWLLYDSTSRNLPALGWRIGAILAAALLLPAIVYRFVSMETQATLQSFVEWIFYLGLLGGVIPPVLDVGYYVTFQGAVGCRQGHPPYPKSLGQCPECARQAAPVPAPVYQAQPAAHARSHERTAPPSPPPAPAKPKAHAWLIADSGRDYQLSLGETSIGKGSRSDIKLTGDTTVSRNHAKIVEQNGRFTLYDLGSTNGTRLNSRRVRQPEALESDDVIEFGDNTRLRFVTTRR